jgi:phosphoribosyl-AMP cyclohydrolase
MLPVICIDGAKLAAAKFQAVRMVAYATELAVVKTLETGLATFWSRSRQSLWTKGEQSGNVLLVRAAYTDCDADNLLLDVQAIGPTCHTGAETCFVIPGEKGEEDGA